MRFPVDKCECGLDLTTVEPVHIIEPPGVNPGDPEVIPGGDCPQCHKTYSLVAPELEVVAPEPEPEAPEEKPEPEAGPEAPPGEAPAEEPGPEE